MPIYITGQLAAIRLDIRDLFEFIEALANEKYFLADKISKGYHKRREYQENRKNKMKGLRIKNYNSLSPL